MYLELLKEREKREPKKFLKCHFFNTFFYKKVGVALLPTIFCQLGVISIIGLCIECLTFKHAYIDPITY